MSEVANLKNRYKPNMITPAITNKLPTALMPVKSDPKIKVEEIITIRTCRLPIAVAYPGFGAVYTPRFSKKDPAKKVIAAKATIQIIFAETDN